MSTSSRVIGTLIVVILKARNLPNKRHIGKQDPYCTVVQHKDKQRTKAVRRGGQHPEWDEELRFTLYEDDEAEQAPASADGTPPPPPPKKVNKGPPSIKGGRSMQITCFAEDVREPDYIGEVKVDLTEVLTKGETDEWFTLLNKDKYSGEVYLELTFWSNEPVPMKKETPKPTPKKSYGGPGTFTPSSDSSPAGNRVDPYSSPSRMSTTGSHLYDSRKDAIPSSLRASNSIAKLDLYVPPYESARSQRQVPSVDSLASDFAEFGVQPTRSRRTSLPPTPNPYTLHRSPSGDVLNSSISSNASYGYDSGSYSDSYGYEPPITPTASYNQSSMSESNISQYQYQAPYESAGSGYPARRPRYSIPATSSGFMPVPSATPSSFAQITSHLSQPSSFSIPPSTTPAPLGYGLPSSMNPPVHSSPTPAPVHYGQMDLNYAPVQSAPTPAPIGYGSDLSYNSAISPMHTSPSGGYPPPPTSHTPMQPGLNNNQTSNFYAHPPQHMNNPSGPPAPPHTPMPTSSFPPPPPQQPNSMTTFASPVNPSNSVQSLPSNHMYQQPYNVPNSSYQFNPPQPPASAPLIQQPSQPVPPPQPTAIPQHTSSAPPEFKPPQGQSTPTRMHVPPPPPLPFQDKSSPQGQGSRPLPQPSASQSFNQPQPRRQSSLPIPPGTSPTSRTPVPSNLAIAHVSYSNIPPPPPLPQTTGQQMSTNPLSIPPPANPNNRVPSSSFPPPPVHQIAPPPPPPQHLLAMPSNPMLAPPPSGQPRRASLPPPPTPSAYGSQQQSAYQTLPPPPPPPTFHQNGQHEGSIAFPSAPSSQAMYPGPLPRPPSQYFPPSQMSNGYPAPLAQGNWQ